MPITYLFILQQYMNNEYKGNIFSTHRKPNTILYNIMAGQNITELRAKQIGG